MPAVRAGQWPVLARNDPLKIFGNQRQQSLLIAAAECRKEVLHSLDVLFDAHRNLSFSLASERVRYSRTFCVVPRAPNHAVEELLLLLEQILEDEWSPDAAPRVHQQAALVKLSEIDGGESKSLRQVRDGSDRVLIIARQKDDAMASLNNRIASQRSRTQVVKTFHDLSAGEGLRNEGGGRETVQFLRWQRKRIHCVDD